MEGGGAALIVVDTMIFAYALLRVDGSNQEMLSGETPGLAPDTAAQAGVQRKVSLQEDVLSGRGTLSRSHAGSR
jgi:hypothetical protein